MIGTNKHEGEMFVHSAFPLTMSKAVYWMFVGALFKDSASRVLKHYRPYITQLEQEAQVLAERQLQEEQNKQHYLQHIEELEHEYEWLLEQQTNMTLVTPETVEALVKTFNAGGGNDGEVPGPADNETTASWRNRLPWHRPDLETTEADRRLQRLERIQERLRNRALKEAAKVVIDYRPVMSRIINDYLFRCPSWHYAHLLSRDRVHMQSDKNNVYVYRFSQPTHVPGYKECWGKSCHSSELPYVFKSMDVIRSNYSTLSKIAQNEAPSAPEYPYTEMLAAYRGALEQQQQKPRGEEDSQDAPNDDPEATSYSKNHTGSFQRIVKHFFDDYFLEDADEEIASDMAQRWVAFARSGNPNYEDSKVPWVPWRYIPKDELDNLDFEDYMPWEEDTETWSDNEEEEMVNGTDGFVWSDDQLGRAYRRRALQALNMEVVEEDELRTELKRTKSNVHDENAFFALKFLSKLGISWKEEERGRIPPSTIRQVQRIAQDMGVLGTGLRSDDRSSSASTRSYWDDDFFPQLLELKWPPEGRLVERDCTCDFWERIRCKSIESKSARTDSFCPSLTCSFVRRYTDRY
jgi:carboxylesterase type B